MRIRSYVLRLLVAIAAMTALGPAAGAAPADPSALVTAFGAQIGQVLADNSITPIERQRRFHGLLDQGVDFPRISCFVLGRYWPGASDSFRQEFSRVFEEYVIQSLSAEFDQFRGDSMYLTGTRAEGDHSTVVSTLVVLPSGAPAARVDWRLQNTPAGLKIEDVSDSGVSMAVSYREQFATVIAHEGGQVAALIPAMRQKLDGQASYASAANARANAKYTRINDCAP
jgi:phospholipid transport system substrate-binding protein